MSASLPPVRPDFYDKLPRYAQMWINEAREEIYRQTQRADIAEGKSAPDETTEVRVGLGGYSLTREMVPLPARSEVEFTTGDGYGEKLLFRMPTTRDVGWIEVQVTDGTILVRPGASNVLYLKAHVRRNITRIDVDESTS